MLGELHQKEGERTDALAPEEEPVTTGTLFILLIFLMAMGALWFIAYLTLVQR